MQAFIVYLSLYLVALSAPLWAQSQYPLVPSYNATDANSPDYMVRAGYSRGNDDPQQDGQKDIRADIPEAEQGNFETAVLDLELFARKMPQGVFVMAEVTANVVELVESAPGWAKQWGARSLGYEQLDANKQWRVVVPASNVGEPFVFTPLANLQNGTFTQVGKMAEDNARPVPAQASALLKTTLPIGMLKDGIYRGRFTLEDHDGVLANGKVKYAAPNPQNYAKTRHIVEWHLYIEDGRFKGVTDLVHDDTTNMPPVFNNQIALITPPWNGREVMERTGKVTKYHHVGLVWRDVVRKSDDGKNYMRTDLLTSLKQVDSVVHERIGRLPRKVDVFGPQPPLQQVAQSQPVKPKEDQQQQNVKQQKPAVPASVNGPVNGQISTTAKPRRPFFGRRGQ